MHIRVGIMACAVTLAVSGVLPAQPRSEDARKGYLGVTIQDLSQRSVKKYRLESDEGALVTSVVEESPAEAAGLNEDDVIVSFDGKPVYDAADLSRFVSRKAPNSKVDIVVWRDGSKKSLTVTIGKPKRSRSAYAFRSGPGTFTFWTGGSRAGMDLSGLTEQLAEYLGVPGKEGVLVQSVKKGSAADKAGLKAGDVITRVGTYDVANPQDLVRTLTRHDEGESVPIEVYRKGSKMSVNLIAEDWGEGEPFFFGNADRFDHLFSAPRLHAPEFELRFRERDEERLRDAERHLKESLEDMGDRQIRLREQIRVLPRIAGSITL